MLIKDDIDDYVECELSDDVSNDGDTPVLWEVDVVQLLYSYMMKWNECIIMMIFYIFLTSFCDGYI